MKLELGPAAAGRRLAAAGVAALALAAWPAAAAPKAASPSLQGVVTQVSDGTTLTLTVAGQPPMVVRLRDIEAPDPCQPGAADARQALSELALNKPAIVQLGRRDAQGRAIGTVRVDEADLGRRMVEEGWAWSVRTQWDRGPLVKQERMAHTLRRGLHAHAGTLSPVDYRRKHGPCVAAASAVPAAAKVKPARP